MNCVPIPELRLKDVFRFCSKLNYVDENSCVEWLAFVDKNGYGQFKLGRKMFFAHRISYHLYYNDLDSVLQVNHICNNPCCVNPKHLYQGTQRQNMVDCVKGNSKGKLTHDLVKKIRQEFNDGVSGYRLAKNYNICHTTIYRIVKNNTWTYETKKLPMFVSESASGRYTSRVTLNKKRYVLGTFDTPEEAHEAALNFRNANNV